MIFPLEEEHLKYIRIFGNNPVQPFRHLIVFAKNNQQVTRFAFKESYETICRYLDDQNVNYGILMFADGVHVFTEKKIKLDQLMVKLSTGMNVFLEKQFDLTNWLKRNKLDSEQYDHLLRENNDKNS